MIRAVLLLAFKPWRSTISVHGADVINLGLGRRHRHRHHPLLPHRRGIPGR